MRTFQSRQRLIIFFILAIAAIYLIRLIQLQLFTEKYKQFANNNVRQVRTIYPPRGIIYDRNKKILLSNEAVYDLMVIPRQVKNPDTLTFCKILNISIEDFRKNYTRARKYSPYKPSVFVKNISQRTYGILQERLFEFRGFFVQSRTIRKFPKPIAAHILGYIGEVNEKQVEASNGYYKPGDYIGITGLERYYENFLRGQTGERQIMVDKFNVEKGSYLNGQMDKPAVPGKHLLSSIDRDLQEYLESIFINKKGGLVAIEPSTGEILALVSAPTFDPALLNGRARSKNYSKLNSDKTLPLFNRAITAMYPPGSTFKIAMALMALQEGVITPKTTYMVNGGYFLPGLKIGDHVHGPVNLHTSIKKSSNAYYCHVFRGMIDQKRFHSVGEGYNNWRKWVLSFGYGCRLGIDLENEAAGILPTKEHYDKIYGKNRWKSPNILSLAIGQAEISLTPLQLANFTAMVANRGYYIQPHLVKAVMYDDKTEYLKFERHDIPIDSSYFRYVIDAMEDVLISGTAIRYGPKFSQFHICGKTGTSQNPHGEDHSVFIAFAPKDNPKIAIAAVVENAGQGAHWAAPICFLGIEKYLSDSISSRTKYIEKLMLEGDFIHPVKPFHSNENSENQSHGE